MKNKRVWLLLAVMGLVGCKNGDVENINTGNNTNDTIKTDTALVLRHVLKGRSYAQNILAGKSDGKIYKGSEFNQDELNNWQRMSEVGDTVIVRLLDNKGKVDIIRNLTVENKAKAFSNQK